MLLCESCFNIRFLKKLTNLKIYPIFSKIKQQTNPRRFLSQNIVKENYYDLLKITPKASQDEIKSAYYKVSKAAHPDLNTNKDAQTKFLKLNEAYKTLSNIRYRSDYDKKIFGSSHIPKEFDEDFKNFIRQRESFKKRSSTIFTGKTSHFDYDEFHRMHYGDAMRQNNEEKRAQRQWQDRRNNEGMEMNTIFSFYCFILTSFIILIIISSKLS